MAKPFRFWYWKKIFIYNCGLDEQYLLLDQPSKTSQKIFLLRKIGNCHICCLPVCCLHFPSQYGIHSNYLSCYYLWCIIYLFVCIYWNNRNKSLCWTNLLINLYDRVTELLLRNTRPKCIHTSIIFLRLLFTIAIQLQWACISGVTSWSYKLTCTTSY